MNENVLMLSPSKMLMKFEDGMHVSRLAREVGMTRAFVSQIVRLVFVQRGLVEGKGGKITLKPLYLTEKGYEIKNSLLRIKQLCRGV